MNIWTKKYNKNNKSVYEISKELNIPEDKIREVIKGEREVPTNDVDRVNGAFSSNTIGITSFERTVMEQFFFDNDIQDLKKKFGYKTLRELSDAMGIGVATMYYFRGDKIKAISDKLLKKAYDFFQNDWNKKVNSKQKVKRENGKVWYYQMPFEDLPKEVVEWYNKVDLKDLLYKEGIKVPELMKKLGFGETYSSIYYKYAKGTVNGCTSNWLLIQQLYNYYHGLELLNTRARHADELYGNINTPTFEYDDIECLDIEPRNEVVEENEEEPSEEESKSIFDGLTIASSNISTTVDTPTLDTTGFVSIEEYNKVCEELERYKFLIDMLIKQER